jgi:hypothetical protein
MNQDKLKALLKHSPDNLERLPDCPDDYQLASYLDGGLSERDHQVFEVHAADCPFCIERIGILGRVRETEPSGPASNQIQAGSDKRANWYRAPRWAAAALVIIAVGFIADRFSPGKTQSSPNEFSQPLAVNERYVEPASPLPEIISPLENSSVDPQNLSFKWKLVPDSLYYDIRIVSDDGELISRQRVWDTQWSPPASLSLQPGAEYFVRVDAFVSEGKALSSEHIAFKIRNGQ